MSSLVEAIRFQSLSAQLTPAEKRQFTLALLDKQPDIVFVSLFAHFLRSPASPHEQQSNAITVSAKEANQMMSNIMRNRKTVTQASESKSLQYLSSSLIGCIASYLDQKSYFRLAHCNRASYVGCNSPNKLHTLSSIADRHIFGDDRDREYPNINFALYPSLNCLRLPFQSYSQWSASQPSHRPVHLRELHTLEIRKPCKDAEHFPDHIEKMPQYLQFDPQQIRFLQLSRFLFGETSKQDIIKLLTMFPNIQLLQFDLVLPPPFTDEDMKQIRQTLPNLKGIKIDGGSDLTRQHQRQFIQAFGEKLESLYCSDVELEDVEYLECVNFSNLSGLIFTSEIPATIKSVLKTAKTLTAACLCTPMRINERAKDAMDAGINIVNERANDLCQAVMYLFDKCERLQYAEFVSYYVDMSHTLKALENALFRSKDRKRTELRIRVRVDDWDERDEDMRAQNEEIAAYISKIAYWLRCSPIDHFMLILDAKWMDSSMVERFDALAKLKEELQSSADVVLRSNAEILTITNRNCLINGYSAPSVISPFTDYD